MEPRTPIKYSIYQTKHRQSTLYKMLEATDTHSSWMSKSELTTPGDGEPKIKRLSVIHRQETLSRESLKSIIGGSVKAWADKRAQVGNKANDYDWLEDVYVPEYCGGSLAEGF